ncbi:MAG: DUF507 family protein [Thermodesulfobacteriota bacterium]
MRLTREQVEKISKAVLGNLKARELLVFKADEARVLEKIKEVVLADLRAEDALDREVDEIIQSHSGEDAGARIDYRKVFNMVKGKLARERGLVL